MSAFTEFEGDVLRILLRTQFSPAQIDGVLQSATIVSLEHSGAGYFLTVAHPSLPARRTVCDKPVVRGEVGEVQCGFVAFIEHRELTLECHGWGNEIPRDVRERRLTIEEAP